MSKNTQLTNLAVSTEADALGALFNLGFLDLFDGVQPANGDTAITSQNMLASVQFNSTAFAAAANGILTANPMTACSAASMTGNATWARCFQADHVTPLMDVSVGTTNANVILNSVAIQANAQVSISGFMHTISKATAGL